MSVMMGGAEMAPTPSTVHGRPQRRPNRRLFDAAAVAVGLGLGLCVVLEVTAESKGSLSAPGGLIIFGGRLAGLTGTYLLLIMLLLIARIPGIERAVGQDRLLRWHRRLGQWPIYLLTAHAALITLGYAEQAKTGFWHELWILIRSYADVLMAIVALALLVLAAVTSIRAARRRMRYETWWTIHLYVYLALALSFSHQLANGASFVGHPLTRAVWVALWVATAGTVLAFRVALPIVRSAWHGLRVVGVHEETPGVVSIVCRGRHVERLAVAGGQFFQWRFLTRGMWWQAHPYSLSAMPRSPYLRVTVKATGDHSERLMRIPVGTRVAIEGPYGAFTRHARDTNKVLLVGVGVGVTPVRALLEDMDPWVDVVVVTRASTAEDLIFREEIRRLVANRGGQLHEIVGSRRANPLDQRHLRRLVPDIADRDVYICGPDDLSDALVAAARNLGVPEDRVHREQFAF
jgi:predicted ferric reductase